MHKPTCLHLLPLLTEMYPDVPCLYEHTGALILDKHAKHDLAWVVMSDFIALVTRDLTIYTGKDPVLMLSQALDAMNINKTNEN